MRKSLDMATNYMNAHGQGLPETRDAYLAGFQQAMIECCGIVARAKDGPLYAIVEITSLDLEMKNEVQR